MANAPARKAPEDSPKSESALARLARDNSTAAFKSSTRSDIGIAFGPADSAVTLEIHRPNIEP